MDDNIFASANSLEELFAQVIIASAEHGRNPLGLLNQPLLHAVHGLAIMRAKEIVIEGLERAEDNREPVTKVRVDRE